MTSLKATVAGLAISVLLYSAYSTGADKVAASGTAEDDAYAAKLWSYLADNQLVGDGRVRSFPFVGSRPHGSIQEVIVTEAQVDGQKGRLIVKHNYGAEDAITPKSVYSADHDDNYAALTIMFQREDGYDAGNSNWFWAEYNPDGSIIEHQGANLSGRSQFCIACHTALGGDDREILNGRSN